MLEPDFEPLRIYLNSLPVNEQEDFSRNCKTSLSYLRKACSTKPVMDGALCLRLHEASKGKVPKQKMRPDIWPELVDKQAVNQ